MSNPPSLSVSLRNILYMWKVIVLLCYAQGWRVSVEEPINLESCINFFQHCASCYEGTLQEWLCIVITVTWFRSLAEIVVIMYGNTWSYVVRSLYQLHYKCWNISACILKLLFCSFVIFIPLNKGTHRKVILVECMATDFCKMHISIFKVTVYDSTK